MILKLSYLDGSENNLELPEKEWQFFVHFGNRNDVDNRLIISNTLYTMVNSGYVRAFFNANRTFSPEQITNVQLFMNDILLFDANEIGFQYKDMFMEYKYNSNMNEMSTQDRGLIYEFRFSNKELVSTEENIED